VRRLLIRPGGIGDTIVSLPALESLRAAYTEVWVPTPLKSLVRFADRVDAIAGTGLDGFGIPDREPSRALVKRLAGFDSIVSWYGAGRSEFRAAVEALGLPFQFFPALPDMSGATHAVDYYLAQARSIGGADVAAEPRIDCPRERGGFAAIHPFSGSPRKNWPLARYRQLAEALGARMPVAWCAGPEEALDGAVRFEDLYDLACWLASASLYVGNDSGITHLAAAVGTPVVALYGPTNPGVWAPRGARVRVVAAADLERIEVEDVLEALNEIQRTPA
jgi:ADP-heptose:LPS heptosyltransferase